MLGQGNVSSAVGATSLADGGWTLRGRSGFPFGYGLSFTSFEQTLEKADKGRDDVFAFEVKVTNTGDTAGKDVVQIYAQSPYTEYDRANGL